MVGAIFGRIVIPHKLQNESFFGPNVLKMTLCIAPAELLLLLNTATDVPAYHKALTELSFTATLDLFDGIEMLNVILENGEGPQCNRCRNEYNYPGFCLRILPALVHGNSGNQAAYGRNPRRRNRKTPQVCVSYRQRVSVGSECFLLDTPYIFVEQQRIEGRNFHHQKYHFTCSHRHTIPSCIR